MQGSQTETDVLFRVGTLSRTHLATAATSSRVRQQRTERAESRRQTNAMELNQRRSRRRKYKIVSLTSLSLSGSRFLTRVIAPPLLLRNNKPVFITQSYCLFLIGHPRKNVIQHSPRRGI